MLGLDGSFQFNDRGVWVIEPISVECFFSDANYGHFN